MIAARRFALVSLFLACEVPPDGRVTHLDCDGDGDRETYVYANPYNCGGCNVRCAAEATCEEGRCRCGAGRVYCAYYQCSLSVGACVPSNDDNCGACDRRCGPRDFGRSRCAMDRCVLSCDADHADCDGDETNGCEVTLTVDAAHCGACGHTCADGEACLNGVCSLPAPRPWRPQSLGVVTSHRPTFAWHLPDGVDAAHLDVCTDRACASIERQAEITGVSHRFAEPFGVGAHFWRLRSRRAGVLAAGYGPTWVFTVSERDLPVDTAWPLVADGDGDGAAGPPPTAFSSSSSSAHGGCADSLSSAGAVGSTFVGDVNGDGFGDYRGGGWTSWMNLSGAGHEERTLLVTVYGSGSGVGPHFDVIAGGEYEAWWISYGIGDFNGDGTADVATLESASLSVPPTVSLPTSSSGAAPMGYGYSVVPLGDVNGDAYMDFLVDDECGSFAYPYPQAPRAYLGNPTGRAEPVALPECPGAPESWIWTCPEASDVNGDGLTDIVVGRVVYYGDPAGISADRCTVRP